MRNRSALVAFVALASLVACNNPAQRCVNSTECPRGGVCEQGFCLVDEKLDAGAGGGVGGGGVGGGGVGGGGVGGGGVGGGGVGGGGVGGGAAPLVLLVLPPEAPGRPDAGTIVHEDPFLQNTAWKLDERLSIQVRSNRPVTAVTLKQSGPARGGGRTGFSSGGIAEAGKKCCDGDAGNNTCFCFDLDLPLISFEAFNGTLDLEASGVEDVRVVLSTNDAGVRVTRWRWSSKILAAADTPRAPAIDNLGRVLVGAEEGAASGKVVVVGPNGEVVWTKSGGAVTAPVAVGRGSAWPAIYVPRRTTGGAFLEQLNVDGGGGPGISCSPLSAHSITSAITVSQPAPGPVETAIAMLQATMDHRLLSRTSAGCQVELVTTNGIGGSEGALASKGNYVAYGLRNALVVREYDGGFPVLPAYPVTVPAQVGMVLTSGGWVLGAGAIADAGQVFRYSTTTGVANWIWSDGGIGTPGQLAISEDNKVFFGESGSLLHRIQVGAFSSRSVPTSGPIVGAPVIGVDGGVVYVATTNGRVHAINAFTMKSLWEMPPPASAPVFDTSPTLDCARAFGTGEVAPGPGTLYVMGRGDGTLYALIVDSKGLDHRAFWPKFQYDARNSGFPDGTFDTSCP